MLVRLTILNADCGDVITTLVAPFSNIMDYIQHLDVSQFYETGSTGCFSARVFKFDFKPRACSPVWHYGLSYQVTTPDTLFYMQCNLYPAFSHYFNVYSNLLDED